MLFRLLVQDTVEDIHEPQWLGKTNFVEIRSFWQIFRSFDRMWSFFILSLQVCSNLVQMICKFLVLMIDSLETWLCVGCQAIIIIACHDLGSPLQLFDATVFEDIISIFITSAILKLIQGMLFIDIITWH